jgi:hypothetical protein
MIDKNLLGELLSPDVIDTPTAIYVARLFAHDPTLRTLESNYGHDKVRQVAAVARMVCITTINSAMPWSSGLSRETHVHCTQIKALKNRHDTAEWYEFPDDMLLTREDTYLAYDVSDYRPYGPDELEVIYGALLTAVRDPGQAYGLAEFTKPPQRNAYARATRS